MVNDSEYLLADLQEMKDLLDRASQAVSRADELALAYWLGGIHGLLLRLLPRIGVSRS